jgi:arsenate reductase
VDQLGSAVFDLVVTVCDSARESCPVVPGAARTVHRPFADPPRLAVQARTDAEALPHYRRARDEIKQFIAALPALLHTPAAPITR